MKRLATIRGFTLLELLVTLSIVAGVISVVLACFEGGFRVYARIRDFGTRESEIYLAGEMLELDLGYLIPAADNRFHAGELRFMRAPLYDGPVQHVYVRAPESGGLFYWVGDDSRRRGSESGLALVPDDLAVSFSFADPENRDTWLSDWGGDTNVPSAIRMLVRGVDMAGDLLVERTIVLTSIARKEEEE